MTSFAQLFEAFKNSDAIATWDLNRVRRCNREEESPAFRPYRKSRYYREESSRRSERSSVDVSFQSGREFAVRNCSTESGCWPAVESEDRRDEEGVSRPSSLRREAKRSEGHSKRIIVDRSLQRRTDERSYEYRLADRKSKTCCSAETIPDSWVHYPVLKIFIIIIPCCHLEKGEFNNWFEVVLSIIRLLWLIEFYWLIWWIIILNLS